jgi:3-isopropylmalate dehydrogenase
MKLKIAVLPGDGVGPEVTEQAVRVLRVAADAGGHEFEFTKQPSAARRLRDGQPAPDADARRVPRSDAVLLGAVGAPSYDSLPAGRRPEAGLLTLRKALGAFANLRPVVCLRRDRRVLAARPEIVAGADVLIVRELLGGLYFGEPRGFGGEGDTAAAFNTMRYSVGEIERVARVAFEAAMARRGKVTSVDKANVLETSQLWRETVTRVARDYPDVTLEHSTSTRARCT